MKLIIFNHSASNYQIMEKEPLTYRFLSTDDESAFYELKRALGNPRILDMARRYWRITLIPAQ